MSGNMYMYVYMSGSVYMYVCMSAIFTTMSGSVYTWEYMEMRVEVYRCVTCLYFYTNLLYFCALCVITMVVCICVSAKFCVLCV